MRLTKGDKKVLEAFLGGKRAESKKLYTDGKTLDGLWMGGNGIAAWKGGRPMIGKHRPHGKADQTVVNALKKFMPSVESQPIPVFNEEVTGSHHGQTDLCMTATSAADRKVLGYVEYSEFDGKIHVNYIFVNKNYRRIGIGEALMKKLYDEYGKANVQWGMMTPEGVALKKRMDVRYGFVQAFDACQVFDGNVRLARRLLKVAKFLVLGTERMAGDFWLVRYPGVPKGRKRIVKGPVPGGRFWADERGHDLPVGDRPLLRVRASKLWAAGCSIYVSDKAGGGSWRLLRPGQVPSAPSAGWVQQDQDDHWVVNPMREYYVVGHRGGLALPSGKRKES